MLSFKNKEIENLYKSELLRFSEYDKFTENDISITDVICAHFLVLDHFLVEETANPKQTGGIQNRTLLLSAVDRPNVGFSGHRKWNSPLDRCATLLFGLAKNHIFQDANKRTALLVGIYFLYKLGYRITCHKNEMEDLIVDIANNNLGKYQRAGRISGHDPEVKAIAWFLKSKFIKQVKEPKNISWKRLRRLLKKEKYELGDGYTDGKGNKRVDIYRLVKERSLLSFGMAEEKKKVCCEGLPFLGLKTPVKEEELKRIRKELNLELKDGYDSSAFFNGEPPLTRLIEEYHEQLRNLADR